MTDHSKPPTAEEIGWTRVQPEDIKKGDRIRVEGGNDAMEYVARYDGEPNDPSIESGDVCYVWTKPKPKPWESIPVGYDKATELIVNGVVGCFYREGCEVLQITPFGSLTRADRVNVKAVEPLTQRYQHDG